MSIEAMKQAIDALEMYLTLDTPEEANMLETGIAPKAITALKQAIEQAEKQELVAKVIPGTRKASEPPKQEPVGYWDKYIPRGSLEWMGLTDEEINEAQEVAYRSFRRYEMSARGQLIMPADSVDWHFARAVEAKLKEKNHG